MGEKNQNRTIIKAIKLNNFTELWKDTKTSDPRNPLIVLNNKYIYNQYLYNQSADTKHEYDKEV